MHPDSTSQRSKLPPTSDPLFKSWEDFYAEVFAVADVLWRSHKYLIAGEIAIATDGTTSGEILPKLRQTLEAYSTHPAVAELGLTDRVAVLLNEIDRMMRRDGKPPWT
jgi:hypothetical protein